MDSGEVAPGESLLHYKILKKIGAGGMGVVWKALDTKLGREVALKLLPSDRVSDALGQQHFIQEAQWRLL